jgi:hypothetical protein
MTEAVETAIAAPEPRPYRKPTLDEMYAVVVDEACRVEVGQRAMVTAGLRAEPDQGQLRKAEVLDACGRTLDMLRRHEPEFRRFLDDLRRGAGPA